VPARQPKIEFPIDQCLLVAGSFFHDFRTPPAPETLKDSGRSHLCPACDVHGLKAVTFSLQPRHRRCPNFSAAAARTMRKHEIFDPVCAFAGWQR
jgi:hypothetical protein